MIKITLEFLNVEDAGDFLKHNAANLRDLHSLNGEPAPDPKEEAPVADPEVEAPKKRTRGRPAKEEKAEKPEGRRRGRPAKEDQVKEEAPKADAAEISDADISKAASEAAKDLTVQVVLDELHEYKVEKVSELGQPQRKEFLERLRELLNPSEAADPAFR